MGNHMNTLEQIKRETRDDARLYACIRDLYDQGVSLSDLKALIPDIRRTREQLQLKRMLQNNNEVLMAMFSQEMSFLLDAKERHEEVGKLCIFAKPSQINGPYRAVSLFCDNYFCLFFEL